MKSGQIFWGSFFVALGALIFLVRLDALSLNWEFSWDLWPLIFIFWGLIVIAKNSKVKPFITGAFGIFLAFVLFGIGSGFTIDEISFDDEHDHEIRKFSQNYDDTIKTALLEVNGGVGLFKIKRSSNKLVEGYAKGPISNYNLDTKIKDSSAIVSCDLEDKKVDVFFTKVKNRLELKLNDDPVWDFKFNIGAAKTYFDLRKFKVNNISLNTGATNTTIKLGNLHKRTNVDVDMGAASLVISVPKSSGCKVTGDMVLVLRDLPGFTKLESGNYITSNFNEAENKIYIDVNSGVSSIKVKRY